jgi:tetratricopeptide (TPR) repeat protein
VLSLGETWASREQLILAARRVGIAQLHLGNIRASREAYENSMRLAEMSDHREGRLVAHIGLGHLLAMQGRWQDAEEQYQRALALCGDEDSQLAGQVQLNLAMTTREREDLGASALWLQEARDHWTELTRADRSVWYNSHGMLQTEAGDFAGARAAFESALAHSGSYLDTAMILDNLAHLCIEESDLTRAESYARRAEEFAIVGGAPRALVEVYTTLAMITRLKGEENGVGFLEKAIELSRAEGYHLALARALQEYALLRERMNDHAAARSLRLEAATLLDDLARQG